MKYYESAIPLACIAAIIIPVIFLLLNAPTYEFYLSGVTENSDEYEFSVVLNGNSPRAFVLDAYVNGVLSRTTNINFIKKTTFEVTIAKTALMAGPNEISFKIYSKAESEKNFGSEEKPYELHKRINNEED